MFLVPYSAVVSFWIRCLVCFVYIMNEYAIMHILMYVSLCVNEICLQTSSVTVAVRFLFLEHPSCDTNVKYTVCRSVRKHLVRNTYTHTHTHTHIYIYIYIYIYMCVCVCVCVCVYIQDGPKVGLQTINTILYPTVYLLLAQPVYMCVCVCVCVCIVDKNSSAY